MLRAQAHLVIYCACRRGLNDRAVSPLRFPDSPRMRDDFAGLDLIAAGYLAHHLFSAVNVSAAPLPGCRIDQPAAADPRLMCMRCKAVD